MSYVPPRELLHGVPFSVADCYGKPHIGCGYRNASVNSHFIADGERCAICGRPATNAHHWPPKGTASTFSLHGEDLKPSLIALCGSGTTGCHGDWHARHFSALWKWDSDDYAEAWWEGTLLSELGPHAMGLYLFGCWELYDFRDSRIWQVRP